MILDSCTEGCGWIAALIACLGFGSFGVPLKGQATNNVDNGQGAHPFVLQTYKSIMCFITSWLVLLLGESFHFSPMGLISGLVWVGGGIGGIYAIRNAGLAISVGTWSGVGVLISFAWGIFAFGERVHSFAVTLFGISMVLIGFLGMSYFSCPYQPSKVSKNNEDTLFESNEHNMQEPLIEELEEEQTENEEEEMKDVSPPNKNSSGNIVFLGIELSRRSFGIIAAAMDGVLTGSSLIPMHYSRWVILLIEKYFNFVTLSFFSDKLLFLWNSVNSAGGLEYVISFGIGAAIVTVAFWILLFFYHARKTGSLKLGWKALPSMYFKSLIVPGVISGTAWSIGNIGAILSVTYLGESIGFSILQCQMVISGLWGILWYDEIKGFKCISGWMLSALLTLMSMLLLDREHVE